MNAPNEPVFVIVPTDYGLPEELKQEIAASVQAFEKKLGILRAWKQGDEWVREYRIEITRLVRAALELKR